MDQSRMKEKEWSASGAEYLVNLLVHRACPAIVGKPLVVLDVVGSTNDWLKDAALRGAPEGFTVLALEQTSGRGRQGRSWSSARGAGVYMSVLLRPDMAADQTAYLGVMGGLVLLRTVRSLQLPQAVLRWPNDVMVGARKIGGVLVEPRIGRKRVQFAIIGMGLNVSQREEDWSPELRSTATSCLAEGVSVGFSEAAVSLIVTLDQYYGRARAKGWDVFCEEWAAESGTDLLPVTGD
jgi:BirA family biotin operon repressor/biotin-[acetyl-CoA-carboxylase] ligase